MWKSTDLGMFCPPKRAGQSMAAAAASDPAGGLTAPLGNMLLSYYYCSILVGPRQCLHGGRAARWGIRYARED